jgi:hypothetical protein
VLLRPELRPAENPPAVSSHLGIDVKFHRPLIQKRRLVTRSALGMIGMYESTDTSTRFSKPSICLSRSYRRFTCAAQHVDPIPRYGKRLNLTPQAAQGFVPVFAASADELCRFSMRHAVPLRRHIANP